MNLLAVVIRLCILVAAAATQLGCVGITAANKTTVLEGRLVATSNHHGSSPDMGVLAGPVKSEVGPGTELTAFGYSGFVDIDFSDTNILITAARNQPAGYWEILRFSDVERMIPDFTCVSVNNKTNWRGFSTANIRVAPDYIVLSLGALGGLEGQIISLGIKVGEPSSHGNSEHAGVSICGAQTNK